MKNQIKEDAIDIYDMFFVNCEKEIKTMVRLAFLKSGVENDDLHMDINLYKEPYGTTTEVESILNTFNNELTGLANKIISTLKIEYPQTNFIWEEDRFIYEPNDNKYKMFVKPCGYISWNTIENGMTIGGEGVFIKEYDVFGLDNKKQLQSLSGNTY